MQPDATCSKEGRRRVNLNSINDGHTYSLSSPRMFQVSTSHVNYARVDELQPREEHAESNSGAKTIRTHRER